MGFASDMFNRLRSNSALLKAKKSRYKKVTDAHSKAETKSSLYDNETINKTELKKFQEKFSLESEIQKRNNLLRILLFLLLLISISSLFYLLLFY